MYEDKIFRATNGVDVAYRVKLPKYDFGHTLVVFSGFMNRNNATYDFQNALNDFPGRVIWIDDYFENQFCYYLCIGMDFKVSEAVTEFLQTMSQHFNIIDKSHVTLTGFSKGGSAALYFALKLDYPNIVLTVPQIKIGNYISENHIKTARHMMGSINSINTAYLNNILPKLLKKDSNLNRNIYLLTSESDVQYPVEILPYISDFQKYNNFNLIKTYSSLVREHNQVTSHHTSLLLGIYYLLANECIVGFANNEVNFFGTQLYSNPNPSYEPYVDLREFNIKNDTLYIGGIALLKGCDFGEYGDGNFNLILKSIDSSESIRLPLAKTHIPRLTKDMFDGSYLTNYDKANFTTLKQAGINLADLPGGRYKIFIEIAMSVGVSKEALLIDRKNRVKEFSTSKYSLKKQDDFILFEVF